MSSRHIIQVSAYYPPHLGGQENAVADLAKHLKQDGQSVEVITSDLGGKPGKKIEDGVPVTRLRSAEFAHTAIIWNLFFSLLRHAKKDTLVHVHVGQVLTPEIVWLASKVRGFKYIIHMHTEPVPSSSVGKILGIYKRFLLNRSVAGADLIIVLNDEHVSIIRKNYGYTGRVEVMNNGVDESYFEVKRTPKNTDIRKNLRLLFVGRLGPAKNVPLLLNAIADLKPTLPVKLDIIGDGEERSKIEGIIEKRALTQDVTLHGKLERHQILEFYATCAALVLPSAYEAQPLVLLEAMASRTPIIATDVLGIAGLVKDFATLCQPTEEGIAEGIRAFYSLNAEEIKANTKKGFEAVAARSWAKLITKYRDLYDEVGA